MAVLSAKTVTLRRNYVVAKSSHHHEVLRTRLPRFSALVLVILFHVSSAFAYSLDLCAPSASSMDALRVSTPRLIGAADIVQLRDLGNSQRPTDEPIFGLSPDGTRVAFMLTQGHAPSNTYCNALIVMELSVGASPAVLDRGGEPIFEVVSIRGLRADYGYMAANVPQWSPSSDWIAYLKREGGKTDVWGVDLSSNDARVIASLSNDVERFVWSDDGSGIIVGTRTIAMQEAQDELQREGLSGILYDDRFVPYSGIKPAVRVPDNFEVFVVGLDDGAIRAATTKEKELFERQHVDTKRPVTSELGSTAWAAPIDSTNVLSPVGLWVSINGDDKLRCSSPSCTTTFRGFPGVWWTTDASSGKAVMFLNREGWANSQLALYRWEPGVGDLARMWVTDDLLAGCELVSNHRLLCGRETSVKPRHLVLIDAVNGAIETLLDPNPEFEQFRLGKVERVHWKNERGVECFGDFVLPPDHVEGQRLPLIVVQYRTRGFLRGGTGDEFPIHVLAANGYAVLSIDKPPTYVETIPGRAWASFQEAEAENVAGWRERRSNLSALLQGVQLVVSRGIIDPAKIGITGLSDGSTTAQFALVNAPGVFSAASVSACCMEPTLTTIYGGPAFIGHLRRIGYPRRTSEADSFWRPLSLAMNAAQVAVPVLMHQGDHELLVALESYTALRDQGAPIELYIFPDEYHLKWQPAHRLTIYQRNLDWFDFWLRDIEHPDARKRAQYERWKKLRERIRD